MAMTPYSDAWREHTRARMKRQGYDASGMAKATGLSVQVVLDAVYLRDCSVALEVAGPIDEVLAREEDRREARGLRGMLVPVACDLSALTNCDVVLHPEARRKP